MAQSLSLRLGQTLEQSLSHFFGDTSGDIPMYSLHKIKRLLKKIPIAISAQLEFMLKLELIEANNRYKEESGNDWSCLTSNNLVDMIEAIEGRVKQINEQGISSIPKEHTIQARVAAEFFAKKRTECIATIKKWFETHSDAIGYDMDGKIPWAVVMALRKNLSIWIVGSTNPFNQNIEEMICEVAAFEGINAKNAEEAWEGMGGTLFTAE